MEQNYSLKKIEPPFWWKGMKEAELQLMLYGSNIAHLKPRISSSQIQIRKVETQDNPNYLFLYLHLDKRLEENSFDIALYLGDEMKVSIHYQLLCRMDGSANRNSFNASDVVYLLMPDRFAKGNKQTNIHPDMMEKIARNKKDGRHGGDINGIIGKLEYLQDLGITALWCTPLLENNQKEVSYHGYASTDLYRIDPRFGSNDDYKLLSEEAAKRNIKLIMDMVPNHIGSNHWWMQDLPAKDWIHQHENFTRCSHQLEVCHDPYVAESDKTKNETGWFDKMMPDLNQHNPHLQKYLKQNAIWWVEYADLDGIRVDTFPYIDQYLAADWVNAIRNEYPILNIVGECWVNTTAQVAYWQSGTKNSNGYDSQLPAIMDFPWHNVTHQTFHEEKEEWGKGMVRLYNHFAMDYLYADAQNVMLFLDNHDTQRFATAMDNDIDKIKLGLTHLLTTRGIPQLYYGTEMGMGGNKFAGDDDIRQELPGAWPNSKRDAFNSKGRTKFENDIFKHTQKLLQFRKGHKVMQTGKMRHYVPEKNVYVYFRYNEQEKVMVVLNNSNMQRTLRLDRFSLDLKNYHSALNILSGRRKTLKSLFKIGAKSAAVLFLLNNEN